MPKREKPSRPWTIDDLNAIGEKGGEKTQYLKAIPVLILEEWVLGGRKESAYFISTKQLERRIIRSGLHPPWANPKATSSLLSSIGSIQNSRKLTLPSLVENQGDGSDWVNFTYYESLLQQYRQEYQARYPDDYEKLFPDGEPEWETPFPNVPPGPGKVETKHAELEVKDEIQSLLTLLEQALRDQQQELKRLLEENQKLKAGAETKAKEVLEIFFVHTSPDFDRSEYGGKVTSIKDTIGDMLKRAEHDIKISTRQMDMFTDELIALKRRSPEITITVLSRGPQGAEGDRRKVAGRKFELMKQAGINLPVETDTLHSRLVIIDAKEVLVSSADLDYTQMDLEFNAGIWTNNPVVVGEAILYFDNLLGALQS
jgi:hypothetical protein